MRATDAAVGLSAYTYRGVATGGASLSPRLFSVSGAVQVPLSQVSPGVHCSVVVHPAEAPPAPLPLMGPPPPDPPGVLGMSAPRRAVELHDTAKTTLMPAVKP